MLLAGYEKVETAKTVKKTFNAFGNIQNSPVIIMTDCLLQV